ncbi:MAG: preprotein translocase subunit SecG [Sphaerochaetaceae bacterium]|jgi:preprotein translocase subunit SecG|nr:preprotein translocase subunit SecG [Sphaerochaetaceae bacterium]MDD3942246.1 preprotein translocase subunit SecG [Sphaerochaetaceae bacterium]MDX9938897.1 preprotein translocase subunit SecG [Sphaerochaetaceae bacterium]
MGVIGIILLILFIIASLLLIFIVAIQSESGTGLGGIFGGGSDSTFGAQGGKVLNKVTAILGTSFLVLAILLAVVNKSPSSDSLLDSVQVEQVQQSGDWWNTNAAE